MMTAVTSGSVCTDPCLNNTWAYGWRTSCFAIFQRYIHSGYLACLGYRTAHSCSGLIRYIFLLVSCWWLFCDCYWIFRWFLRYLYLFFGFLVVDFEVNVGILYFWLLFWLFYFWEMVRRFLWCLDFVAIRIISIHSCYLDVYKRKTSVVCEDKLIFFLQTILLMRAMIV